MEHESDDSTNFDWCFGTVIEGILKGLEDLEVADEWRPYKRQLIEEGQNTEKSPGDLGRLDVTQNPVDNYQLTLIWKTLEE